jgi:hypothetical protein
MRRTFLPLLVASMVICLGLTTGGAVASGPGQPWIKAPPIPKFPPQAGHYLGHTVAGHGQEPEKITFRLDDHWVVHDFRRNGHLTFHQATLHQHHERFEHQIPGGAVDGKWVSPVKVQGALSFGGFGGGIPVFFVYTAHRQS